MEDNRLVNDMENSIEAKGTNKETFDMNNQENNQEKAQVNEQVSEQVSVDSANQNTNQGANKNEEHKDFWRKVSDAIPQKHVGKLVILFVVVILVGLGFNIYSTFWGTPKIRGIIKEKDVKIEQLMNELENSDKLADDLFKDPATPLEDNLNALGENASTEDVFGTYANSVVAEESKGVEISE